MAERPKEFLGFHEIVYEGRHVQLQVFRTRYWSTPGRLRIDLEDVCGRPFATLSLHMPRERDLGPDEFVVKDGAWTRDMLGFWLFQDTGKLSMHGRPIWRLFDLEEEIDDEEALR